MIAPFDFIENLIEDYWRAIFDIAADVESALIAAPHAKAPAGFKPASWSTVYDGRAQ